MKSPPTVFAAILLFWALSGCESLGFRPYNYETCEKARLELKKFKCSVDVDSKEFKLKTKIPLE